MNRQTLYILILVIISTLAVAGGRHYWRAQRQGFVDEMRRHAERYSGATGPSIEGYDEIIARWLAEMKEESIEVILQKLTDAAEWQSGIHDAPMHQGGMLASLDANTRERQFYHIDIETILSNRRFRKAYEDLQKMDKEKAAKLLTKNIGENVAELRKELHRDISMVSRGEHKGCRVLVLANTVENHYRSISRPDIPPTRLGRHYAVLTYIWLAALLELREVRPAVEESIQLAQEEFKLVNSIEDIGYETFDFRHGLVMQSLYNPSLLVTATLCDPTWNAEQKKRLEEKLVNREIVDWYARSTEYNWHGKEGWVPVVPHGDMLKIRYYKGVTDAEFNEFFGE